MTRSKPRTTFQTSFRALLSNIWFRIRITHGQRIWANLCKLVSVDIYVRKMG